MDTHWIILDDQENRIGSFFSAVQSLSGAPRTIRVLHSTTFPLGTDLAQRLESGAAVYTPVTTYDQIFDALSKAPATPLILLLDRTLNKSGASSIEFLDVDFSDTNHPGQKIASWLKSRVFPTVIFVHSDGLSAASYRTQLLLAVNGMSKTGNEDVDLPNSDAASKTLKRARKCIAAATGASKAAELVNDAHRKLLDLLDFDYSPIDAFVSGLLSHERTNHDLGKELIERGSTNLPPHFAALLWLLNLGSDNDLAGQLLGVTLPISVRASDDVPGPFDPCYSALKPLHGECPSLTLLAVFFVLWGGMRNRCIEPDAGQTLATTLDAKFLDAFKLFRSSGHTGTQCRNDTVVFANNRPQIEEASRLVYFLAWKLSVSKNDPALNLHAVSLDRNALRLEFLIPSDRIWDVVCKYAGSLSVVLQHGFEHVPSITQPDERITGTDKELCRAILRVLVMFGTGGKKRRFSFSVDQRGNLLCVEFVRIQNPDPLSE